MAGGWLVHSAGRLMTRKTQLLSQKRIISTSLPWGLEVELSRKCYRSHGRSRSRGASRCSIRSRTEVDAQLATGSNYLVNTGCEEVTLAKQLPTLNSFEVHSRHKVRLSPYPHVEFGVVNSNEEPVSRNISIANHGGKSITLRRILVTKSQNKCNFEVETEDGSKIADNHFVPIHMRPGKVCHFKVNCTPGIDRFGQTREICVFEFSDVENFRISSWLTANIQGREARLKNNVFVPKRLKPNKVSTLSPIYATGCSPIPVEVFRCYRNPDVDALEEVCPSIFQDLNERNYKRRFELCLWFEEIHRRLARREYDMKNVILTPGSNNSWTFNVPHLEEISPQLLLGEKVNIQSKDDLPESEGNIVKIYYGKTPKLEVEFQETFNKMYKSDTVPINIRFPLGSSVYKRMHYALNRALRSLGKERLFPEQVVLKQPLVNFFETDSNTTFSEIPKPTEIQDNSEESDNLSGAVELKWFNNSLNLQQKNVVRQILKGQGRPLPYIVFGPPGTGKTATIVEAILQVYFLDPNSRILVTVPSNAGADLITEKLIDSDAFIPGDFVRLIGFVYGENDFPDRIAEFCESSEDIESVVKHRLIVATVNSAGQFFSFKSNNRTFSHVFVDEAGYCTEPETLIPCVLTAIKQDGQIILSGDPQQLGPVLFCDVAQTKGILQQSLLERLMNNNSVYSRDVTNFPEIKYNPAVLTKLVRSYRCHPLLLNVSSELFYSGDLNSHANKHDTHDLCESLNFIPKKGVPLVFHGVKGQCSQGDDSYSWYNMAEIEQIVDYVRLLLRDGVSAKDIGVITPYRKQVSMLTFVLESRFGSQSLPKIATVQEFQGGERKVIIISTVRSSDNGIHANERFDFIYSPKRFNVAITRAKSLMIIVGDPDVLCGSHHWKKLMEYAIELEAYVGCRLPKEICEGKVSYQTQVPISMSLDIRRNKSEKGLKDLLVAVEKWKAQP